MEDNISTTPILFNTGDAASIINDKNNQQPKSRLFGNLIHDNEVTLLFGDSNTGKSLLAMDIAISIAYGIDHWTGGMSDLRKRVLYIDMEQDERQFTSRYLHSPIVEDGMLQRGSLKNGGLGHLNASTFTANLEQLLSGPDAPKVVIVDNLTYVLSDNRPASSLRFMQEMKRIKNDFGVSVIVIAHTIKRNMNRPLTQNDLGGSKNIMNFADSAIGVSMSKKESSTRYVKVIKSRSGEPFDKVAEISITHVPYLHFDFVEWNDEESHLRTTVVNRIVGQVLIDHIQKLHDQGRSVREISLELLIPKSTVQKHIQKLEQPPKVA